MMDEVAGVGRAAYVEFLYVPGTGIHYDCQVFCDECPDGFYGPYEVILADEGEDDVENIVCGSCWDSGLSERSCPHLRKIEQDEDKGLWITCDSEDWEATSGPR